MAAESFVILILCPGASLDDLIHERQKHQAVAIDILNYEENVDYYRYKDRKFEGVQKNEVNLMFVFGKSDSVIIRDREDLKRVETRLKRG